MTIELLNNKNRLDWLDGARGIAIIFVMLVHISFIKSDLDWLSILLKYGQYGVQIFFVISTLTCILTFKSNTLISDWYIKRITRISVVYFSGIFFYYLNYLFFKYIGVKKYIGYDEFKNIIANFFYLHAWIPSANNSVVPGGWSIAIEIWFYIIFPFLIFRLNSLKNRLFLLLFLLLMLSLNFVLFSPIVNNSYEYFSPLNQIPVFLWVLLIYSFVGYNSFWLKRETNLIFLSLGFLLMLLAGFFGVWYDLSNILAPNLIGCGFFMILLGLGELKKIFELEFLVYLGRISFSLYIIHFFVIDVIRFIIKYFKLNIILSGFSFWFFILSSCFIISIIFAHFLKMFIEDKYIYFANKCIKFKNNLILVRSKN